MSTETTRELSITFSSGGYQSFEEIESGCTTAQIVTFASVCGGILSGTLEAVDISDRQTITFGS